MKISVLNLGCKVNQAECSEIKAGLAASGHHITDLSEKPDLCIINTCSVTAKSDYQSRQLIRRARRLGARVIVTGCYADLNRGAVLRMEGVERVFANSEKSRIVGEIGESGAIGSPTPQLSGRSRFTLKVQDGCNYSCSYCLIPKARGRSRSLSLDSIRRKVEELSLHYQEIVLTGIHLGTYGYDLLPQVTLSHLLKALLQTPIGRIRLSSLEINEINDELLEVLADERVCRHLHIPVQSGDDRILRLMQRRYDINRFVAALARIREYLPDISIGTDAIVGFPTEDPKDFERSYRVIESLPFSYIHVFPFSVRPGTKASLFTPQVAEGEKRERAALLSSLGIQKKRAFMDSQLGKILDPLLETECDDHHLLGTTGNYLKVKVPLDPLHLKKTVSVRITGSSGGMLIGAPMNS